MNKTFLLMAIILAAISGCRERKADPAVLINTDRDFSRMSMEKGLNAAFISYAADSVVKMRDGDFPIIGKQAMTEVYRSRPDSGMVLSWEPVKAEVSTSGDLGYTFGDLGRFDEAMQSYDRCLAIDPENLDALRNKGFLLRNQKRLEEALLVYDSVLQRGGDAYDQESTAAVLTALGRLEEALSCLYLAREAMPLKRLEDEIEMVKGLMEQKGIPIPQERAPPEIAHQRALQRDLQGKE